MLHWTMLFVLQIVMAALCKDRSHLEPIVRYLYHIKARHQTAFSIMLTILGLLWRYLLSANHQQSVELSVLAASLKRAFPLIFLIQELK